MLNIEPNTSISFLKTPLLSDYKNQLTFKTESDQIKYMNSRIQFTLTDYVYTRKDGIIKVNKSLDEIIGCNYIMYKNNGFSNKYYYAFITKIDYISENCCSVSIQTDVYQTWMFEMKFKPCFIEREHTNDDSIGANIVDEGLQLSEYVCNNVSAAINTNSENLAIVVAVTESATQELLGIGNKYNGIYSGLAYFFSTNVKTINNFIKKYDKGKANAIQSIFIYPRKLIGPIIPSSEIDGIGPSDKPIEKDYSTYVNKSLNGYTPKNNKLLIYPYNYLLCSNNNGADVVYRYEDFDSETLSFKIQACITPSGNIRIIPLNYKGLAFNSIEGLNLGKFPICNWTSDVYQNWLSQNALNIPLQVGNTALSSISSVATGNISGSVSSIFSIGNILSEAYKQDLAPNQSHGNINCGDVVAASGYNDFIFYSMSIKKENAKIIDDYFSMFGYKTNLVKMPNLTCRQNWNYIKTIDCNIVGDIPQEDLQILKSMFNNGITLWHNPSTIFDYSQNNSII